MQQVNPREIAVGGAAALFVAPWAVAKAASEAQQGVQMVLDPMSSSPLAEPLIRIGEIAIAKENDAALDAYFAPDFKNHGPGGELTYEELKAYFAALRAAFTNFQVRRAAIIGEGSYLAARTILSGTFVNVLTQSPVRPLQPHGKQVEWEVMNLFRYNEQGCLAEEWVRYDVRDLLQKLGAA